MKTFVQCVLFTLVVTCAVIFDALRGNKNMTKGDSI